MRTTKAKTGRVRLAVGSCLWLFAFLGVTAAVNRPTEATVSAHHADEMRSADGARVVLSCVACHDLRNADKIGPRLGGVIGRPAGSVPGFEYSAAMRASGLVWDEKTLVRFLVAPEQLVPGTNMSLSGMAEEDARAVVNYLKEQR
ncbi:c-type cytochrome [Rhizobacter sp. LjRoot28]|jgi:cytochrome c|uniref:c-type cytochrome n=1 Tax=Rhizobacter sp. LjRoot28 TaxID=3342309 RepID=UPI003ECC9DBB